MACYPRGEFVQRNQAAAETCQANKSKMSCFDNNFFSCILNLIIILIVLDFLSSLLCNTACSCNADCC